MSNLGIFVGYTSTIEKIADGAKRGGGLGLGLGGRPGQAAGCTVPKAGDGIGVGRKLKEKMLLDAQKKEQEAAKKKKASKS